MSAKADDRRVRKTRRALYDALMELILEKGYEAVTVQDILDRADVGRTTFYTHYMDKQQLLEEGVEELRVFLGQSQPVIPKGSARPLFAFSLAMFEHAASHAPLYRRLVGKQSGRIVIEKIEMIIADMVRADLTALWPGNSGHPPEDLVTYVVSAYLGLLSWWIDQPAPCPAAEIDRRFRLLTLPGVEAAMDKKTLLS